MTKENDIKVSVLMLSYNQEAYIEDAVRSVMHQLTDFDFRLVIGDDCSTDSTLAICRRLQTEYGANRIEILPSDRNVGLLANFKRTFEACSGIYIAICEGDDYWTDRMKLQIQADFLDSHPDYSTCVHRVVNYYQDEGTLSKSNGGQKAENDIIDLARSNFISNVSAMFRRGLFGDLPEWMLNVATYDYAIHLMNAEYGKIHYINRCMAVYRKHRSALWSQSGAEKQYIMAMTVRKVLMEHFKMRRPDVYAILLDAYVNNAVALLCHYARTAVSPDKARCIADEVLAVSPSLTEAKLRERIDAALARTPSLKERAMALLKSTYRKFTRFMPVPKPA